MDDREPLLGRPRSLAVRSAVDHELTENTGIYQAVSQVRRELETGVLVLVDHDSIHGRPRSFKNERNSGSGWVSRESFPLHPWEFVPPIRIYKLSLLPNPPLHFPIKGH